MRLALISVILACVALAGAPVALADGDPASDVLVGMRYFDPVDLSLPASTSARLDALLGASARAGFPIRVAMIQSATDLGTATALWQRPKDYAQYLQTELSLLYDGQVLVVMPNGFGLWGPAHGPHAVTAAELHVRALAPGPGARLADAALSAVPRLAAAAGHPIGSGALRAAKGTRAAAGPLAGGGVSGGELLALVLGALLIAVAWGASLRARPPAWRRGVRA